MPKRAAYDVVFYMPAIGPLFGNEGDRPQDGTGPPGGAETQIYHVSRALAERGARVCVVAYDTVHGLPRNVDGVALVAMASPGADHGLLARLLRRAPRVRELLLALRALRGVDAPVFVQRTAGAETGYVALAAKLQRRRFVYSSSHVLDFNFAELGSTWSVGWWYRFGTLFAQHIVVQTNEQEELCRRRFRRSPTLIRSIAEPAPARSVPAEAFLWIGRLATYKKPEIFVELARSLPEARFRLVGVPVPGISEPLEEEIRQAAETLPNLELLSPRPRRDVLELISRSVAVVNTSDYEGLSNIFLEAWVREVPALALAHDPDGLIDRHRLGMFAGGSLERMVEAATSLWSQRSDNAALGARCREYVVREHAPEVAAERWAEVLALPPRTTPA